MKLISFIKSLLPHFDKDRVLEDIRITLAELESVSQPSLQTAADFFKTNRFQSDEVKGLADVFTGALERGSIPKQSNMISEVSIRMPNIITNLRFVLNELEKVLENDILAEGLTARKAALLRITNGASFISRYIGDLLNYVYVFEARAASADVPEDMGMAPFVIKNVEQHIESFSRMVSMLGMKDKEFLKLYEEIPEIIINSKTASAVEGVYKEREVDPFGIFFTKGATFNPVLSIRMVVAEWQASRYKANKDKKKMLELRLLYLKLKLEKKEDPKIQNEIDYIQSRVDRIERDMREVEESLGIGE